MSFVKWPAGIAVTVALAAACVVAPPASAVAPPDADDVCWECLEFCVQWYPEGYASCYSPREMIEREVAVVERVVDSLVTRVEHEIEETKPGASTAGAGTATGSVAFAWPGVPKAGEPCAPASFTLSGSSEAFALNTVITGYAGPVTLTGSGASPCEGTSAGNGTLTLSASGIGPTGSTVQCPDLTGAYTRAGTDVVAQLGGACVVNNYTAPVSFVFRGEFAPSGTGAGVTTSIRNATFHGAFVVMPA